MSDCCYVEITVRAEDFAKWEELGYLMGGLDEFGTGAKSAILMDEQRNYGVSDQDRDLVPGSPMYGRHEEGSEYGPFEFAWDGKTFMEQSMLHGYGGYYVPVPRDTLEPDLSAIDDLKKFLAFRKEVEAMVDRLPE